ncbi:MAG TPA: cation diffusion facilitator family transporter [bacterium]|nr:cation diffusion facilitator family transporter [bacterium]HPR87320.1 cation diffusion facilitator family transporter [bacterium]
MTPSHSNFTRAFAIGIGLNSAFVLIEAGFGLFSGSLALIADAGHNLSDVLGLVLAWGASRLAERRPTARRTYGLRRTSILAATLNATILLIAVGIIGAEAVERLMHPAVVAGGIMIPVAAAGVVVNGLTARLFHTGGKQDLNIRGAFLHMAADAAISLGVIVAGVLILLTGWPRLDAIISLIIALIIAITTGRQLRRALDLSLDAVPEQIDPVRVREFLCAQAGVTGAHDLHIWAMSTTETALTVHLIMPEPPVDDDWLTRISHELHDRFHIGHATIQIEKGNGELSCRLAPDHLV